MGVLIGLTALVSTLLIIFIVDKTHVDEPYKDYGPPSGIVSHDEKSRLARIEHIKQTYRKKIISEAIAKRGEENRETLANINVGLSESKEAKDAADSALSEHVMITNKKK